MKPSLIHPVQCKVASFSDRNVLDSDFGEVADNATAYERPVSFSAQVKWSKRSRQEGSESGNQDTSLGYLTILAEAQDTLKFKSGDKITAVGAIEFKNLFISEVRPIGHYSAPKLFRLYLVSRDSTVRV